MRFNHTKYNSKQRMELGELFLTPTKPPQKNAGIPYQATVSQYPKQVQHPSLLKQASCQNSRQPHPDSQNLKTKTIKNI
jgi:hypothetical protein